MFDLRVKARPQPLCEQMWRPRRARAAGGWDEVGVEGEGKAGAVDDGW
jgi:hypothetical protein